MSARSRVNDPAAVLTMCAFAVALIAIVLVLPPMARFRRTIGAVP